MFDVAMELSELEGIARDVAGRKVVEVLVLLEEGAANVVFLEGAGDAVMDVEVEIVVGCSNEAIDDVVVDLAMCAGGNGGDKREWGGEVVSVAGYGKEDGGVEVEAAIVFGQGDSRREEAE